MLHYCPHPESSIDSRVSRSPPGLRPIAHTGTVHAADTSYAHLAAQVPKTGDASPESTLSPFGQCATVAKVPIPDSRSSETAVARLIYTLLQPMYSCTPQRGVQRYNTGTGTPEHGHGGPSGPILDEDSPPSRPIVRRRVRLGGVGRRRHPLDPAAARHLVNVPVRILYPYKFPL